MTNSRTKEFLMNHPKLLATLFALTVLLSQSGAAIASNSSSIAGP